VATSVHVYRGQAETPAAARALAWEVALDAIASALGVAPDDVVISRQCSHCDDDRHGKPTVVGAPDLSFSLCHSGAFALVVIARDACVGVDCEQLRPRGHLERLAARVLADDAYAEWSTLDEAHQLSRFLESWTAKEAYLKAIGLGIATSLRSISEHPDGWTMHALDQQPNYIARLAVEGTAPVDVVDAG
jgi:4'-phosphopantetheinyl transferase